jgi:hypothetical protein
MAMFCWLGTRRPFDEKSVPISAVDPRGLTDQQISVLVQCLLFAGSKSYSHIVSVLERNLSLLHKICADNPDAQMLIVREACQHVEVLCG